MSIVLPPLPADLNAELGAANGNPARLRELAAANPTASAVWGALARDAFNSGDDIGAYAFARTGYHRGLDAMRANGWNPSLTLSSEHPSNHGMLECLHVLMLAAAAISEGVEARRCREFLLQLDPADHFNVEGIQPKDLSSRLETS